MALVTLLGAVVAPHAGTLLSLSLVTRALVGLMALAIPGLLMGGPFPMGLGKLAPSGTGVAWARAANGTASVLAASIGTLLAVEVGGRGMLLPCSRDLQRLPRALRLRRFPIEGYDEFRPDLVLMYFASLHPETGRLSRLELSPLRIRRLRLEQATSSDREWMRHRLAREYGRFGADVVRGDGGSLAVEWAAS